MSYVTGDFCRGINGFSVTGIVELLSRELGFSNDLKNILQQRYNKMRTNFLKVPYNAEEWRQVSDSCDIGPVLDKKDALYSIGGAVFKQNAILNGLGEYCNIGMDLPVWFAKITDSPKKQKKVMIIAQDPLRNGHDKGKLILSTPWGVHSAAYATPPAKAFKKILQYLVDDLNFCVYMTDCTKFYFSKENPSQKLSIAQRKEILKKIWPPAESVIKSEVDLFNPDITVTLGKDVILNNPAWGIVGDWKEMAESLDSGWIKSQFLGGKTLLPLYHPSPLNARGNDFLKKKFKDIHDSEKRWEAYFKFKLESCLVHLP